MAEQGYDGDALAGGTRLREREASARRPEAGPLTPVGGSPSSERASERASRPWRWPAGMGVFSAGALLVAAWWVLGGLQVDTVAPAQDAERVGGTPSRTDVSNPADAAIVRLRQMAERGDPSAQTELGARYADGRGVAQDDEAAAGLYRLAAEQGHAPAQYKLGVIYRNGRGVTRDDEAAIGWYRRAADGGYAPARYQLGVFYENSRESRDYEAAVEWYRGAAELGYAPAQYELGYSYRYQEGRVGEALWWYRLAAEQGYARAQTDLGDMYSTGSGVGRDDGEAARWYRLAAEQGYGRAQFNLGNMHAEGRGVSRDGEEATRWYRRAAEQGYRAAQQILDRDRWPASPQGRRGGSAGAAQVAGASAGLLHAAARTGDVGRIRGLLASGIDANAFDGNGQTPLHVAAAHGEVGGIGALIDGGADPNALGDGGFAPLHVAVAYDQMRAVEALLTAGAGVNVTAVPYSTTPLHLAVGRGARRAYALYMDRADHERLFERVSSVAMVGALLAAGANPNAVEYFGGDTSLQQAAMRNDGDSIEVVRALLAAGANPSLRASIPGDPGPDDFSGSPLHLAAWRGNVEIVEMLVGAGAVVNATDYLEGTPLDMAERNGHDEAAAVLRAQGAKAGAELLFER